MGGFLDWITGRTKAAAEIEMRAAQLRAEQRAMQDVALERAAGKQPESIKRVIGQGRPAEILLPGEAVRMRDMHDNPRSKTPTQSAKPSPQVASRMAYTATAQPPPSMGGSTKPFVNPRVHQSIWKDEKAQAKKDIAAEQSKQHEQGYDMTPDPSSGRTLK